MLYSLEFYEDVHRFYNHTKEFLLANELENVLLFSILNSLKKDFHCYGEEDPLLISIESKGNLSLVALQTPPHNLVLSFTEDIKTIPFLAEELLSEDYSFPGVLGFKEGAEKFAHLWGSEKALNSEIQMLQRIHKLETVNSDTLSGNKFYAADPSHENIILKWAKEFIYEAMPEESEHLSKTLERTKQNISNGEIYLLKDNEQIVSMARMAGETPNGRLVNLVFTPPELRGNGYATQCVAHLSQLILDKGYNYSALFTDLSNPVSNKIYYKIGYRPVIDFNMYRFNQPR